MKEWDWFSSHTNHRCCNRPFMLLNGGDASKTICRQQKLTHTLNASEIHRPALGVQPLQKRRGMKTCSLLSESLTWTVIRNHTIQWPFLLELWWQRRRWSEHTECLYRGLDNIHMSLIIQTSMDCITKSSSDAKTLFAKVSQGLELPRYKSLSNQSPNVPL